MIPTWTDITIEQLLGECQDSTAVPTSESTAAMLVSSSQSSGNTWLHTTDTTMAYTTPSMTNIPDQSKNITTQAPGSSTANLTTSESGTSSSTRSGMTTTGQEMATDLERPLYITTDPERPLYITTDLERHLEGPLQWDVWTSWSHCSRSCDHGEQVRLRLCSNDSLTECSQRLYSENGNYMIDYQIQKQQCIPGVSCTGTGVSWSEWQTWQACSVTCGRGTRLRSRACLGGNNRGTGCPGNRVGRQFCHLNDCPIEFHSAARRRTSLAFPDITEADKRPSACALGGVAVGVIVILGITILLLDLPTLLTHIKACGSSPGKL